MRADQPDQAAGLRRRSARLPPACIYCFFDTAEWPDKLAAALQQAGRTSLLIDRRGRLFAAAPTRSLFDWKQQLERGQLHILSLIYGDGWYAPGVRADEPALRDVARAYDHLLFDEEPSGAELILIADAANTLLIEVQLTQPSMQRAYTLLKTLSHTPKVFKVSLLGDQAACAHVLSTANHFLSQPFVQAIACVADVDTAFSALAVRMPIEETSWLARSTIRKHENMALKHGG
jgi:hypothetical protein